MGVWGLGLGV